LPIDEPPEERPPPREPPEPSELPELRDDGEGAGAGAGCGADDEEDEDRPRDDELEAGALGCGVKTVWLEDGAALGAEELPLELDPAEELRPFELLLPMVKGDEGLPIDVETGLDDETGVVARAMLVASLIDPSRVVRLMPFSFVTEPGLARVPEFERELTTIECEG